MSQSVDGDVLDSLKRNVTLQDTPLVRKKQEVKWENIHEYWAYFRNLLSNIVENTGFVSFVAKMLIIGTILWQPIFKRTHMVVRLTIGLGRDVSEIRF